MDRLPPIHPGEILGDEMETISISANALARDLDVPVNRVTEIVNGKRAITADTALRLGKYFGTSPQFWLNLQTAYDLALATAKSGAAIAKRVRSRAA
jgi:addiction module HigA family antidote